MAQPSERPAAPAAAQAAAMTWSVTGVLIVAAFVGWAAGAAKSIASGGPAGAVAVILGPVLLAVTSATAGACFVLARGIWRNSATAHVISLVGLVVPALATFAIVDAYTIPIEEKTFALTCLAVASTAIALGGIRGLASRKQRP